ncbi:MAG: thiaminase II [Sarcina sp.]
MNFTDYLFEGSYDIWKQYLEHPFIKELGEGTLDKDKFKEYLIEDYLYLKEYTKVFAIGLTKVKTMREIKFFYNTIKGILEDENAVHIEYLKEMGIDLESLEERKCSLENFNYTSYMLKVALEGDIKAISAVIMPCTWSYYFIGSYLKETYGEYIEDNFYKGWIEAYSSEEYKEIVELWMDYINKITLGLKEEEKKELIYIFKKASIHELAFWDMAYKEDKVVIFN